MLVEENISKTHLESPKSSRKVNKNFMSPLQKMENTAPAQSPIRKDFASPKRKLDWHSVASNDNTPKSPLMKWY